MEYFNPHSNTWLANKFEIYKELRARNTAYYSETYKMYVITRYADILYALSNPNIFSSAKGNLIVEMPYRFGKTLGASDNPMHDFLKNIVKKAYAKENIDRVIGSMRAHMLELISNKEILNLSDIVDHLSAHITAEILGIPGDKTEMRNMIVDIQRRSSRTVANTTDDTIHDYFTKMMIEMIFRGDTPATQNGIYKEYIEHSPKNPAAISLFIGPTISGTSSMTGGLQFLTLDLFTQHQLDTVLADRSLIPNAVNESLRYRASTGRFSRTVTQDFTMHGVELKAGDRVALCLESANRDPGKFPNPEIFDLQRNTAGHLAFGHGLHACIAMAISKAVMSEYLIVLLDTIGKYKITTDPKDYQYVMTASGNDDMISNLVLMKA